MRDLISRIEKMGLDVRAAREQVAGARHTVSGCIFAMEQLKKTEKALAVLHARAVAIAEDEPDSETPEPVNTGAKGVNTGGN